MIKPDEMNKITPEQIGIVICTGIQVAALAIIILLW